MSFDISVIDIAILIALIVLFALYLTGNPKANQTQRRILKTPETTKKTTNKPNQQKIISAQPTKENNCAHYFGYLRKQKQKNIPQECTGCTMLVKCLLTEE